MINRKSKPDGYLLMAYNYPQAVYRTLEEAKLYAREFDKAEGLRRNNSVCDIWPMYFGKKFRDT